MMTDMTIMCINMTTYMTVQLGLLGALCALKHGKVIGQSVSASDRSALWVN